MINERPDDDLYRREVATQGGSTRFPEPHPMHRPSRAGGWKVRRASNDAQVGGRRLTKLMRPLPTFYVQPCPRGYKEKMLGRKWGRRGGCQRAEICCCCLAGGEGVVQSCSHPALPPPPHPFSLHRFLLLLPVHLLLQKRGCVSWRD